MKKWILSIFAVCVIITAFLWVVQDDLLLPGGSAAGVPRCSGCEVVSMIPDGRDSRHAGFMVIPKGGRAKGIVVFFHGNAGTAADRAEVFGNIISAGYAVFAHEYAGFGYRDGERDISRLVDDALSSFDMLRRRLPSDVGLHVAGESFGAAVAAEVAAARGELTESLTMIVPWDSLSSVVSEKSSPLLSLLLKRDFNNVVSSKRFLGKKTVVIAKRDEVIPNVHAEKLAAELEVVPVRLDSGHNDWSSRFGSSEWVSVLSKPSS